MSDKVPLDPTAFDWRDTGRGLAVAAIRETRLEALPHRESGRVRVILDAEGAQTTLGLTPDAARRFAEVLISAADEAGKQPLLPPVWGWVKRR